VAICNALFAGTTSDRQALPFASSAPGGIPREQVKIVIARRASVPSPTGTPASSSRAAGAIPLPSFKLLPGL